MTPDRCRKCLGPLSTQGSCYKLACVPEGPSAPLGRGSFHGNLNMVSDGRKARKMCPLCREAGCWPSVCHNGPPRTPGGIKRQCDCHRKIGHRAIGNEGLFARSMRTPLHVRHF